MKFGVKHFWEYTPKVAKKIGYAIMAGSTFAATTWQFYFAGNPKYTMALVVVGVIGKTITSFFGEETTTAPTDPNPGV